MSVQERQRSSASRAGVPDPFRRRWRWSSVTAVPSSQGSRTRGPQLLSPSLVVMLVAFVCMAGVVVVVIAGQARGRWVVPTIGVLFPLSIGATVLGRVRRRNDSRDRHQVDCSLRVGSVGGL